MGAKNIYLLDYCSTCLSEWENTFQISIGRVVGRVAKFGHYVSGELGSNFKIDFLRSRDTYSDASYREKYNDVFF